MLILLHQQSAESCEEMTCAKPDPEPEEDMNNEWIKIMLSYVMRTLMLSCSNKYK